MIVDKNSGLKDSEKRNKYQDLTLELKKINEHEDEGLPIVIGALWTVTEGFVQELEDGEIKGQDKQRPSKLQNC